MTTSRETGEKQRHEVIKYEQSGKLHWVCFQVAADSNLSETFRERERERERESYKNYSMKQPQWMMVSEVDSGISGVQFAGNN